MKVQLFHAPYVDSQGVDRRRLCAVLTRCAPDDAAIDRVLAGLKAANSGDAWVFAFEDSIEVEWL